MITKTSRGASRRPCLHSAFTVRSKYASFARFGASLRCIHDKPSCCTSGAFGGMAGFSMLELLLAISITSGLLLVAGNFVMDVTLSAHVDHNKTVVQSNTKQAVDSVARVIRQSRSVMAQNSLPDPNSPGATADPATWYGWSGAAGTDSTLILAYPARDADGNLLYQDGLHTQLHTDEIIFYLDPSTRRLYKRTLANPAPGNVAKTTCPPDEATASCPADAMVVEDIASLATEYFDANNQPVSVPSGTEAVGYSVKETVIIGGKSYSSEYSTNVALRNR